MDTHTEEGGAVITALLLCLGACVAAGLGVATGLGLLVVALAAL